MKRYTTDTELKNKYKDLETEYISEESEREAEEDMSRARKNRERKTAKKIRRQIMILEPKTKTHNHEHRNTEAQKWLDEPIRHPAKGPTPEPNTKPHTEPTTWRSPASLLDLCQALCTTQQADDGANHEAAHGAIHTEPASHTENIFHNNTQEDRSQHSKSTPQKGPQNPIWSV